MVKKTSFLKIGDHLRDDGAFFARARQLLDEFMTAFSLDWFCERVAEKNKKRNSIGFESFKALNLT